MNRQIDLAHEAVVAVLAAIDRAGYVSMKKEPVGVTGIIEKDVFGQINATDSESSMRTAVSVGYSGEIHIRFDFQDVAS